MLDIVKLHEEKPALLEKHVNNYVVSSTGCWEYQGRTDRGGYGEAGIVVDCVRKHYRVHRLAYFHRHGVDPKHLLVCHHCDNPSCINPDHLYIGTNTDNMRDVVERGRQRGSNNTFSKLTEENVIDIKKRLAKKERHASIAEIYGVKCSTISNIATQGKWSHVQLPSESLTKELHNPHQMLLFTT